MSNLVRGVLLSLLICLPAWAGSPVYTGFFSDTAIKGYDPVAYFSQGEPRKGDAAFSHRWNDADWHFVSAANRDLFAASPQRYAPQYGGYCAYALATSNSLAKIDPDAWTIVDDKLYLNYSLKIRSKWLEKQAEYIATADKNWPQHLP